MKKLNRFLSVLAGMVAGIFRKEDTVLMANAANPPNAKTHPDGIKTYLVDADVVTMSASAASSYPLTKGRYLLVMTGSDESHVKAPTGTTAKVLGICLDSPEAAEDEVAVQLLSAVKGTVKMVAAGAISVDAFVCPNSTDGLIKSTAGSSHDIGRAVQAAGAAGDIIEVIPMMPHLV